MHQKRFVPKSGAVSAAWKILGFNKTHAHQSTTYCKVCRATVVATSGNTSNLLHDLCRIRVGIPIVDYGWF